MKVKALICTMIIFVILISMGCASEKRGDSKDNNLIGSQNESKQDVKISIEDLKEIIIQSEEQIVRISKQETMEQIGFYNVSPIYGFSNLSRQDIEAQLSTYFSQDILKYVLATHMIVCSTDRCGLYTDSEGQYQVNVVGRFSLGKQTSEFVEVKVPFQYKGLDLDQSPDTYGTYKFKIQDGNPLIVGISQEFNDQLYNDDIDLRVVENEADQSVSTMSNYVNEKYGFDIDYPASWNISEESASGDGINLYEEDGNDIRTYGGYYPLGDGIDTSEIDEAKEVGIQVDEIETLQGIKGYVYKEKDNGNNIVMRYIVYGSEVKVQLYADVTSTFYSKNSELLLDIAKSIYITDGI